MSLFNRVTQSLSGATLLVDNEIMKVFTKCDFVDARPEGSDEALGQ